MSYVAMSNFVFGQQLASADMNQILANIVSMRDGTGLAPGAGTINVSALTLGGDWTAGTPNATGFSAKTTDVLRYVKIGRMVTCYVEFNGTSNGTGLTFTLPYAAQANSFYGGFRTANNGAALDLTGRLSLTASSTTATAGPTHTTDTWTGSNSKFFIGDFVYRSTT